VVLSIFGACSGQIICRSTYLGIIFSFRSGQFIIRSCQNQTEGRLLQVERKSKEMPKAMFDLARKACLPLTCTPSPLFFNEAFPTA